MSRVISLHVIRCYDWNPMQSVNLRSGYDWNVIVPHRQYPETGRCVYSPGFHQKERNKERKFKA